MQTTYNQPDISLTYVNGGLDRYGRVVNHSWVKNNGALVHIVHGYDYAGNRLYRNDIVQNSNSELYAYDDLGQIKMLRRGALNADKTNVPAVNHSEAWNFDKTGNWAEYNKNGMTETRTHNVANELQGITTHDANGNMTLMPGLKGKYDAWNRLIEVRNADDVIIATYEYNGLNQRIKKTVGGVLTKSFYNENWQEVESVTGSQMTSYIWGVRYIDDLVLREKGEERLYSMADANWNVVALVNTTGAVVERMKYDAFGKITWLDATFGVKAASSYAWNRTFTGQVLDSETGLMLYRNRYFNVLLGRWTSRDPIGYRAKDVNLYRYVSNRCLTGKDIMGLSGVVGAVGPNISGQSGTSKGDGQCIVRVHCWPVIRWGLTVGTYCGYTLDFDGDVTHLDGSGSSPGTINQNRISSQTTFAPGKSFAPSVCECLLNYADKYEKAKIPRSNTAGNSNWMMSCMSKSCGIKVDWHGNPPSFHNVPPCKRYRSSAFVCGTICDEYYTCP